MAGRESAHLVTLLGIPIKVHWTFSFILVFIGYIAFTENLSFQATCSFGLYVFCLFTCVILHEYGHALMARYYGIQTTDIIISPIGGLARLENMPSKPVQELMVAIAGPAVNLVIATVILGILYLKGIRGLMPDTDDFVLLITNPIGFLFMLLLMNIVLCLFNLIPAFPMDGGRVLRALLSLKLPRLIATFIAAMIGKSIAIGFVLFGAYHQIFALFFIGIFVFVMAGKEYKMLKQREEQLTQRND